MTYDGTNLEEIRAQAFRGRIIAVVWGWRQHKIVRTKTAAAALQRELAEKNQESVVHEYDADTLDRLWTRGNFMYRLVHGKGELQITEKPKRAVAA